LGSQCSAEIPEFTPISHDHMVACHIYQQDQKGT
jgi:hypothetical protein